VRFRQHVRDIVSSRAIEIIANQYIGKTISQSDTFVTFLEVKSSFIFVGQKRKDFVVFLIKVNGSNAGLGHLIEGMDRRLKLYFGFRTSCRLESNPSRYISLDKKEPKLQKCFEQLKEVDKWIKLGGKQVKMTVFTPYHALFVRQMQQGVAKCDLHFAVNKWKNRNKHTTGYYENPVTFLSRFFDMQVQQTPVCAGV
jgi:hypothetical protein